MYSKVCRRMYVHAGLARDRRVNRYLSSHISLKFAIPAILGNLFFTFSFWYALWPLLFPPSLNFMSGYFHEWVIYLAL